MTAIIRCPLPPGAAADQADAYAVLLDTPGIGHAAVLGYSGGAPRPSSSRFATLSAEPR